MKYFLLFLTFAFVGCQSLGLYAKSGLTQEQSEKVVSRARELAMSRNSFSEAERRVIQSTAPLVSYYFISGPRYADYSIQWLLPDGVRVAVSGRGNLLELEGAMVSRLVE